MLKDLLKKYKEWESKEPKVEPYRKGNIHINVDLKRELVTVWDMSRTNSITICLTIEEAKDINKYFNKIFKEEK